MQKGFRFLVDSREKPKTIALYDLKNIPYEVEALQADIVLQDCRGDRPVNVVGFEKKRWDDLYQSIITQPKRHDKPRFLKQIDKLTAFHEHGIVIIYGDFFEIKEKVSEFTKFNTNRIWGTLSSIAVRAGVEVFCFPEEINAIEFAWLYCQKFSEGKFREKRSKLPQYKRFHPIRALMLVPGVTKETAQRVLAKYGCLRFVGRAVRKNPDEVRQIKGMGEMRTKSLNRLMNEEWP